MRGSAAEQVAATGMLRVLVALLVALGLAATACGDGLRTDDLDEIVASTGDAGPLQVVMAGTASITAGRPLGTFDAVGVANLGQESRDLRVDVERVGVEPYQVDVVAALGETYAAGLPGIEADAFVEVLNAPAAVTADLPIFVDPSAMVGLVGRLAGTVTERGEEDVRGVPTRRVRVSIPESRMVRMIETILDSLGGGLSEAVADQGDLRVDADVELWVDADDVIRRFQLTSRAAIGGGAIPGIGAVDSVILMEMDPVDEATPGTPELVAGTIDFATLIGETVRDD